MKLMTKLALLFIIVFSAIAFSTDVSFAQTPPDVNNSNVIDNSGIAKQIFCDAQLIVRSNIGVMVGLLIAAAGFFMFFIGADQVSGLLFMAVGVFLTAIPGLFISLLEGTTALFRPLTGVSEEQPSGATGFSAIRDHMESCVHTEDGGAATGGNGTTTEGGTPTGGNAPQGSGDGTISPEDALGGLGDDARAGADAGSAAIGENIGAQLSGQGFGSGGGGGGGNGSIGGGSTGGGADTSVADTSAAQNYQEDLEESIASSCQDDPTTASCQRLNAELRSVSACLSGDASVCNMTESAINARSAEFFGNPSETAPTEEPAVSTGAVGRAGNGSGTGLFDSVFGGNDGDATSLQAIQDQNNSVRSNAIASINNLALTPTQKNGFISRLNLIDDTLDPTQFNDIVNAIQAEAINLEQGVTGQNNEGFGGLF